MGNYLHTKIETDPVAAPTISRKISTMTARQPGHEWGEIKRHGGWKSYPLLMTIRSQKTGIGFSERLSLPLPLFCSTHKSM